MLIDKECIATLDVVVKLIDGNHKIIFEGSCANPKDIVYIRDLNKTLTRDIENRRRGVLKKLVSEYKKVIRKPSYYVSINRDDLSKIIVLHDLLDRANITIV